MTACMLAESVLVMCMRVASLAPYMRQLKFDAGERKQCPILRMWLRTSGEIWHQHAERTSAWSFTCMLDPCMYLKLVQLAGVQTQNS